LDIKHLHEWPNNPEDAVKIQEQLKSKIELVSKFGTIKSIAAIDTAYSVKINRIYATAVSMTYPGLEDIERVVAEKESEFPYIPSLLSFREGPTLLKTLTRLKNCPDMIIFAGHGIAHPRLLGLASHMGLILGIPSIGCARRCLTGEYRDPPAEKGGCSSLFVSNIECGFVYRTKANVKPMFISPGHMCSIRDALDIVVKCLREYRMPHPLRMAHLYANKYRLSAEKKLANRNMNHNHSRHR
jgi:deoxyribonuclease V